MDNGYERIEVKVPSDRVAQFYEMYGRWLAGADESPILPNPDPDSLTAWSEADEDLAAAYWAKLSSTAKAIFGLLMDTPGRKFTGDEIAAELGIDKGSFGVAGAMAWPGRHAYALGRKLPVEWQADHEVIAGGYWMVPEVATLFRRISAGG